MATIDSDTSISSSPPSPCGLFTQNLAIKLSAARLGSKRKASLVIPRLYISDAVSAMDARVLRENSITHILSVTQHPLIYPKLPGQAGKEGLTVLHIPLMDTARADLLGLLVTSTGFIQGVVESPEKDWNVLVHCVEGISRSVSVVCAYLISAKGYTAAEAVDCVKSRRSISCPNPGFMAQLYKWAERLEEETEAKVKTDDSPHGTV